jgi:gas vesicle protein
MGEKEIEMTKSIIRTALGSSLVAALAILLGTPAPASAQNSRMRVNRVERRQQAQIRQGVKNGSLSKQQAAKLEHQEKDIKNLQKQDNANGAPTSQERSQLKDDLQHQQQSIRHDETTSPTPATNPQSSSSTPPLG